MTTATETQEMINYAVEKLKDFRDDPHIAAQLLALTDPWAPAGECYTHEQAAQIVTNVVKPKGSLIERLYSFASLHINDDDSIKRAHQEMFNCPCSQSENLWYQALGIAAGREVMSGLVKVLINGHFGGETKEFAFCQMLEYAPPCMDDPCLNMDMALIYMGDGDYLQSLYFNQTEQIKAIEADYADLDPEDRPCPYFLLHDSLVRAYEQHQR